MEPWVNEMEIVIDENEVTAGNFATPDNLFPNVKEL